MNIQTRPLSENTQRATHILMKEMGIVDTLRFMNQFSIGEGDYTKERAQWLDGMSLDEIITQIKKRRGKL
jgi:hypothetical protein